jgi:cyclomaltodextrinase
VRATVHLRRAHPALRRGTYRTRLAEGECYAFERVDQAERLVVAFNTAGQDMTLRIPFESSAGQPDVVFGSAQASFDGDTLVLQAPPRSGMVIALKY